VAEIEVFNNSPPVICYSCHFEVFCGLLGRVSQLSEILRYSHSKISVSPFQVICGDLNTMAHGIARLSTKYCTDRMRWSSLGWYESHWIQHRVLQFTPQMGEENHVLRKATKKGEIAHKVYHDARNPGFWDPFDSQSTVTLENYKGWYWGKLDWVLLRGFRPVDKGLDNLDYRASDHRLLWVDVTQDVDNRWANAEIMKHNGKGSNKLLYYFITICIFVLVLSSLFGQVQ
jgi:hypothetical protein